MAVGEGAFEVNAQLRPGSSLQHNVVPVIVPQGRDIPAGACWDGGRARPNSIDRPGRCRDES
jgi:hypothetical protein